MGRIHVLALAIHARADCVYQFVCGTYLPDASAGPCRDTGERYVYAGVATRGREGGTSTYSAMKDVVTALLIAALVIVWIAVYNGSLNNVLGALVNG